MSEKLPPSLKGFTDEEYYGREEYDPERVANLETGYYDQISEHADMLLVAVDCSRLIPEDSPQVVYSCDTRELRRTLQRYDYITTPDGSAGMPLETQLDIRYKDHVDTPGLRRYEIEVKRNQDTGGRNIEGMSELYILEKHDNYARLNAEVAYPDVVNDTYASRRMTPYDEKNLYNELAIMSAYMQFENDRVRNELISDGN